MVFPTSRNQTELKASALGIESVYSLWNLTHQRYFLIEYLMLSKNFTHDRDFIYVLDQYIEKFQKETHHLESLLGDFSIKGPIPNISGINVQGNPLATRDKLTSQFLLYALQLNMLDLNNSIANAVVSDEVREFFTELLKSGLDDLDKYIKYIKIKGWIEVPPLYPYIPADVKERVSTSEVYYLWKHLQLRYLNTYNTIIYSKMAYDGDFAVLLKIGVKFLEGQTTKIEQTLLKYGINLPIKYSNVTPTPETTEWLDDRYMFNVITNGIITMSSQHGMAIKNALVNDEIRNFFVDLLIDEITFTNKMIKYGKTKGWFPTPPGYKMA